MRFLRLKLQVSRSGERNRNAMKRLVHLTRETLARLKEKSGRYRSAFFNIWRKLAKPSVTLNKLENQFFSRLCTHYVQCEASGASAIERRASVAQAHCGTSTFFATRQAYLAAPAVAPKNHPPVCSEIRLVRAFYNKCYRAKGQNSSDKGVARGFSNTRRLSSNRRRSICSRNFANTIGDATSTLRLCSLFALLNSCRKGMAMQTVRLSSGYDMPIVGLGTWQAKPDEMEAVITSALGSGYRHIDTAFNYNNEEAIGKSLKKWFDQGGKREDLFITTKLPHFGNRPSDVEKFIKLSLEKLGLQYLDLYLVHMPFAFIQDKDSYVPATNEDGTLALDLTTDPVLVWKEMEKQVKAGRVRSIGLSNFNETQIQNILNNSEIKPSNLQVELHAYMQQRPLREFCKKNNISITGYSPIGSPGAKQHFQTKYNYSADKFPDLLGHPVVQKIANDHNRTTAQVLLRHAIQGGVIVIPKSSNPQRIKSNIELFDFTLTDEEMNQLNALDHAEAGRIFNFLFFKGVEKHPLYPFKDELS